MFNVYMTSKTMKLLPLLCLCLLTRSGTTFADEQGPVIIKVEDGSDGVLPCSLSTEQNIEGERFEWKKDGQEFFFFDAGIVDENQQFKGRVSHFDGELQYGNASIIIRNTKVSDSGNYTCDFPHLQSRQIFHIQLVVGAASKPSVKTVNQTKDWALLQCDVRGASPKPTVEWQDSAGNKLPAEEPQVSERGGRFNITLQTTVKKTDRYRCVATQEEIKHQIDAETFVFISGGTVKENSGENIVEPPTLWVVAVVLGFINIGLLGTVAMILRQSYRRNSQTEPPKESLIGLVVAVFGVITVLVVGLLCTVLRTLHQNYRQNSQTGFPTGWVVVDVVFGVINTFLVGGLAVFLFWRNRRNSHTGSTKKSFKRWSTRLDVAVDVVVLAVAVLALIQLWYYQRVSPAGWAVAVLSTVVVVVLALYLVLKWAPHLRGE